MNFYEAGDRDFSIQSANTTIQTLIMIRSTAPTEAETICFCFLRHP